MTPATILALVRDVFIVAVLGVFLYILISYGKDLVKVSDMKAVQKQLATNQAVQDAQHAKEDAANAKRDSTIAALSTAIAAQRAPVLVYAARPSSTNTVPATAIQAGGVSAHASGVPQGCGGNGAPVDIRPALNAFELKYASALADAQRCLDDWPTGKTK